MSKPHAYVRVVVGEKGEVVHINYDSLYASDQGSRDFYSEELQNDALEYLDESISDAEVLVLFHPHSYLSGAPWDGQEWETEIVIDHTFVMQEGYKEHWRKGLTYLLNFNSEEDLAEEIEEWEEAYNDEFLPFDNTEDRATILNDDVFDFLK